MLICYLAQIFLVGLGIFKCFTVLFSEVSSGEFLNNFLFFNWFLAVLGFVSCECLKDCVLVAILNLRDVCEQVLNFLLVCIVSNGLDSFCCTLDINVRIRCSCNHFIAQIIKLALQLSKQ